MFTCYQSLGTESGPVLLGRTPVRYAVLSILNHELGSLPIHVRPEFVKTGLHEGQRCTGTGYIIACKGFREESRCEPLRTLACAFSRGAGRDGLARDAEETRQPDQPHVFHRASLD